MPRRYIRHTHELPTDIDLEQAKQGIAAALVSNVKRVQENTPDAHLPPDGNVYTGVAGTAVMNQYLSKVQLLPQSLSASELASLAYRHLDISVARTSFRKPRNAAHVSFLDTLIGQCTLVLVALFQTSDVSSETYKRIFRCHDECIEIVRYAIDAALREKVAEDGGCEILYGRAGLLYAVLLLRSSLPRPGVNVLSHLHGVNEKLRDVISNSTLNNLVKSIIDRGKLGSRDYTRDSPALMWSWHGKRYLGAAHGVAGILQMILNCPAGVVEPYIPDILDTVNWLADLQDPSGNWPTKAPTKPSLDENENELLQWCHGAPGVLILFSTLLKNSIYPISPKLREKLNNALKLGASVVFRHGLLRKGLGLCHGVGGSVFSLLAVSDVLHCDSVNISQHKPHHYLLQATQLAHLAISHEHFVARGDMKVPDCPWSLYEGMAGMCCAWACVLDRLEALDKGRRPKTAGIPGYTDILIYM